MTHEVRFDVSGPTGLAAWLAGMMLVSACAATMPDAAPGTLHARGEYTAAERAAARELKTRPDDPALWHIRMDAVIRGGDAKRGVDLYMEWHHRRKSYDTAALRAMAMATLWRALDREHEDVRIQALDALGELATRELDHDARALLGHGSERVAAAAAALLAGRDARARARAMELLRSASAEVRATCAAGLGRARGDDARGALAQALADTAPGVRREAVRALARRQALASDELIRIAREDTDGSVRAAALQALARTRVEAALPVAQAALADAFLGARLAALAVLASFPDQSRERIAAVAASGDLFVALRAAVTLRRMGAEVPAHMLEWALRHPSVSIRAAALNALGDALPANEALSMLAAPLGDERMEVRLAAARVLVRLGRTGQAAEIFAAALEAPRDEVRVQAAADLVRMNDGRGLDALARLGRSPARETRQAVVRAHRGTDNPTLPLVAALGDAEATVRVEAAASLLALLGRR